MKPTLDEQKQITVREAVRSGYARIAVREDRQPRSPGAQTVRR